MASTAQFASNPKVGIVNISTANTNRDGTGTIGTVFTAGTSGSRIDKISIQARATTTSGMVRLFIHNGSTSFLFKEVPVIAIIPAASVPAFQFSLSQEIDAVLPIILPTGYSLRASTEKAENFNIIASGGDF